MHIYFSGIGGAGIGPLAMIAHQAGYEVSGSDQQDSSYIEYLRGHGMTGIHVGQSSDAIADIHHKQPIDWLVYSSSITEQHPELVYCREQGIKTSKRDELLNQILQDNDLQLIAIAGTHGKTTTTAMTTWLFTQLEIPVSYLLPAKTSFAEMGCFNPESTYFIYEADEFDRNFLAYHSNISLITGVSWDHQEIFPTRKEYQSAFRDFIAQSQSTVLWEEDRQYLGLPEAAAHLVRGDDPQLQTIQLLGAYNRRDAWLAVTAVHLKTDKSINDLISIVNRFPGLSRRMEPVAPHLYSDYAHTPEKIRGAMSVASEMAAETDQKLVVIYEPLTNRRQHYMLDDYQDCFAGADRLYWIPSYLAREDPKQRVIPPAELIAHLADPSLAEPMERDQKLKKVIRQHLDAGDMVVAMAGGGGNSLDDWLREEFAPDSSFQAMYNRRKREAFDQL